MFQSSVLQGRGRNEGDKGRKKQREPVDMGNGRIKRIKGTE